MGSENCETEREEKGIWDVDIDVDRYVKYISGEGWFTYVLNLSKEWENGNYSRESFMRFLTWFFNSNLLQFLIR